MGFEPTTDFSASDFEKDCGFRMALFFMSFLVSMPVCVSFVSHFPRRVPRLGAPYSRWWRGPVFGLRGPMLVRPVAVAQARTTAMGRPVGRPGGAIRTASRPAGADGVSGTRGRSARRVRCPSRFGWPRSA